MKQYCFITGCMVMLLSHSLLVGKTPHAAKPLEKEEACIKILLQQNAPGLLLESKGSCNVYDPASGKKLSSSFKGKRYYLHAARDGLKWGEGFPGIYQLAIQGEKPQDTLVVDGIEHEGCLNVYAINQQVSAVNRIPIESYLKTVMSSQFDGDHHDLKVLKAVAIAMRTKLYYLAAKNKNAFWHIDHTQERFLGCSNAMIDRYVDEAVESTCSTILTFNYRPFSAEWHPHSAGITAGYPMVFRKNIASPIGVESAVAKKDREKSQWSYALSKTQLAELMKTERVVTLDTFEDPFSKRVYAIRIKGDDRHQDFDFFSFQRLIGSDAIKSNNFQVVIDQETVKFQGFGRGHGVGLCLYSANEMAKKGSTVEEILLAFFPNTLLQEVKKLDFSQEGFDDF
jgi:SpoIID/LytB domain protein